MLTGLLTIGAILLAAGWFAIGWTARGQENRKYAESRLRTLAAQSAAQQIEQTTWVQARRAPVEPPPIGQPVIHVHMPPTITAPMWPQPPVINQSIPMIEGRFYEND